MSGSYCPDIYRNDPHYTFRDGWWEGDEYRESRYKGEGLLSRKAVIQSQAAVQNGLQ